MRAFLLCLSLTIPGLCQAEIYRSLDEHGNPVFSDQPPADRPAERLELPPTPTVDMPAPPPSPPPLPTNDDDAPSYRTLDIGGLPDDEGALRANNGTFTVYALLDPPLRQGHRLRFVLDEQVLAHTGNNAELTLTELDRGEHRLRLEVLAADRVVQRSDTRTFTLQRVHTSSPAMRRNNAP